MKNDKSYPFPTYSGLLNSEHYDKIGRRYGCFSGLSAQQQEKSKKTA